MKLPVADLDASRAFYTAALAPFGYRLVYDKEPALGCGVGDGGDDDEPFALLRAHSHVIEPHERTKPGSAVTAPLLGSNDSDCE